MSSIIALILPSDSQRQLLAVVRELTTVTMRYALPPRAINSPKDNGDIILRQGKLCAGRNNNLLTSHAMRYLASAHAFGLLSRISPFLPPPLRACDTAYGSRSCVSRNCHLLSRRFTIPFTPAIPDRTGTSPKFRAIHQRAIVHIFWLATARRTDRFTVRISCIPRTFTPNLPICLIVFFK